MIRKSILSGFQKFDRAQSLGGILLFGATILALIIANSELSRWYENLRDTPFGIEFNKFSLIKPLIQWINDGLMAIFFFMIGLEIKRELVVGELNSPSRAALPLIAAAGGMAFPILIFLILNGNPEASHGWGIPMATDIAFSLAILKLLGKRVPIGLKVFLAAIAIIGDLGAVIVITLFYGSSIDWTTLAWASIPIAILIVLSFLNYFSKYFHLLCGLIIWYLFLKSGLHPTTAGVILAFTVPLRQRTDVKTFSVKISEIANGLKELHTEPKPLLSSGQMERIGELEEWTERVQSPLQHLEHVLQSWVAYFIIPVFAFFNAGVTFSSDMQPDIQLVITLALSLFLGKTIGVMLFSFLSLKLKFTVLPEGVSFGQIAGISILAGVGFTMSMFIANLAFADAATLMDSAKIGILTGSMVSGLTGYLVLRYCRR
jgi:Na+:H+ antiporter, NhaA family